MDNDFFIQQSIKHPNRTKTYLMRIYGNRAFKKDGEIKSLYLEKAITRAKAFGFKGLEKALVEARTLKKLAKEKEAMG